MRVGLVVDEVPDASQLRLGPELVEPLTGSVGRKEIEPGDHAPDPRVLGRLLEHRVGVEVGARRLHEDSPLDTSPLEKWLEILRLEVRRMTACSSVSHDWASRSRFQKCWWVSMGIAGSALL